MPILRFSRSTKAQIAAPKKASNGMPRITKAERYSRSPVEVTAAKLSPNHRTTPTNKSPAQTLQMMTEAIGHSVLKLSKRSCHESGCHTSRTSAIGSDAK